MHAFAFGELGLMPDDYFDMLPKHYYAKVDGYNNRRRKDADLLRMSVWVTKTAEWKGAINYEQFSKKFFPIAGDTPHEPQQQISMTQAEVNAVFERHKKVIEDERSKS